MTMHQWLSMSQAKDKKKSLSEFWFMGMGLMYRILAKTCCHVTTHQSATGAHYALITAIKSLPIFKFIETQA